MKSDKDIWTQGKVSKLVGEKKTVEQMLEGNTHFKNENEETKRWTQIDKLKQGGEREVQIGVCNPACYHINLA